MSAEEPLLLCEYCLERSTEVDARNGWLKEMKNQVGWRERRGQWYPITKLVVICDRCWERQRQNHCNALPFSHNADVHI
jgi:hypothetical protein